MESVAYHIQRHPVSCFCSHWLMYENPILVQTWHCLEYTSLAKLKASAAPFSVTTVSREPELVIFRQLGILMQESIAIAIYSWNPVTRG
ncbi:hypothetical protein V6N12_054502 [Hibiscus sabdariffa]|uniref:Uncharacterized protein n=1 Tax=Hibiscus sabdariffa TaxID=183260 RepID=A0ABR2D0N7_9ROSI